MQAGGSGYVSRRKRGKRRTSPGKDAVAKNTGDATQPVPASVNPSPDVPPRRRRFVIAAGIVGCWWAVLITLVVLTANPVTLNRRQLRNSSRVVTAEIVDVEQGTVKVVKDWIGSEAGGNLAIDGLKDLGVENGKTYILPLSLSPRGSLRITPAPDSPNNRLVYPASDDALKQLAGFLKDRTAN